MGATSFDLAFYERAWLALFTPYFPLRLGASGKLLLEIRAATVASAN
jgi:hypothetical protein